MRRALLTSTLLTLATATSCHLSMSQLYHLPNSAAMTICTRSSSVKTRAAKADALATLRPCRGRCTNSRPPRSESINAYLAELNLPRLRFDGGLEVLGKGGQEDVEHLGDTKISSATKIQALPPPDSPVGVEEDPMKPNPNEDTPPPNKLTHPAVTINEEPITSPALECSTTTGNTSTRGSALKNPSPAQATDDVPPMPQVPSLGKFTLKGLEQGTNYIIHRNQKMYSMRNNNKQEQ